MRKVSGSIKQSHSMASNGEKCLRIHCEFLNETSRTSTKLSNNERASKEGGGEKGTLLERLSFE